MERAPTVYDPRGFKATCISCHKPFYIPWETMCDAGYCDKCLKKMRAKEKKSRKPEVRRDD